MNIPSATVLASTNVNGWPSPSNPNGLECLTRLDSVRLRCGSVFRSAGASTLRITPHAASFASCATFNSHVQLLSFGQSFQAFHDAPHAHTLNNDKLRSHTLFFPIRAVLERNFRMAEGLVQAISR